MLLAISRVEGARDEGKWRERNTTAPMDTLFLALNLLQAWCHNLTLSMSIGCGLFLYPGSSRPQLDLAIR